MMTYVFVRVVGLAAGALSGLIGTGSTIILLPILVYRFGPKKAVPIMAISALLSNIGKAAAWWHEIDWRAFAAYSITGIPAAALGARTLLVLPSRLVDIALGAFFLVMIPARRWLKARPDDRPVATGPLWRGHRFPDGRRLVGGPSQHAGLHALWPDDGCLPLDGSGEFARHHGQQDRDLPRAWRPPAPAILQSVIIGSTVMGGAFVGKAIVQRMDAATFQVILDGLLLLSGLALLSTAFT